MADTMKILEELLAAFPKPKENLITIKDTASAYKLGKDEGYNKALMACENRVREYIRAVRKGKFKT